MMTSFLLNPAQLLIPAQPELVEGRVGPERGFERLSLSGVETMHRPWWKWIS